VGVCVVHALCAVRAACVYAVNAVGAVLLCACAVASVYGACGRCEGARVHISGQD